MKKTAAKKTAPAKKATAVKESPILKEVKQLYGFMQDNNIDTIEYDQKGLYLRLVKAKPAVVPVPVNLGGAVAASGASAAAGTAQEQYKDVIKSTLTGIFFRGSTPSAPPFAKEGARVNKGDVICLIEAMKVFNEVRAEFPCIIKKVLVENGKPVKQGEALFAFERV
ncbi:MAG: acetyl-CoA carboxylase biotin carboxyl carrier protein [Elusimicrobia bacterium]|nr:acetyl-CoA carboxylase biotin carboxyl carrier protein [Elusimicrobiota bacterium]MDY6039135.1 biotin/lipoyl-containing protein [Elusimicrobiaceae bacterium]